MNVIPRSFRKHGGVFVFLVFIGACLCAAFFCIVYLGIVYLGPSCQPQRAPTHICTPNEHLAVSLRSQGYTICTEIEGILCLRGPKHTTQVMPTPRSQDKFCKDRKYRSSLLHPPFDDDLIAYASYNPREAGACQSSDRVRPFTIDGDSQHTSP